MTTALSVVVRARRERVWSALADPQQLLSWDGPLRSLPEPLDGYPRVGRSVSWRYELSGIPILFREVPLEVVPEERLRSEVALGLFRFDQTWSLADDEGDPGRTRVGIRLGSSNSIPVLGAVVDRFDVRRFTARYVDAKIRNLRSWCETRRPGPTPPQAPPPSLLENSFE